jgi:hypothetical protein
VIAVKLYSESGSTPDDWELQGLAVPVNLKNVQTNWSVTSQPGKPKTLHVGPPLADTTSKGRKKQGASQ